MDRFTSSPCDRRAVAESPANWPRPKESPSVRSAYIAWCCSRVPRYFRGQRRDRASHLTLITTLPFARPVST
jgi:hypothetical protein